MLVITYSVNQIILNARFSKLELSRKANYDRSKHVMLASMTIFEGEAIIKAIIDNLLKKLK